MTLQSGERITKLDELQDIDELYVEEVRQPPYCLRAAEDENTGSSDEAK